ncbi:unnamed protein product, partial [Allacma fusca]
MCGTVVEDEVLQKRPENDFLGEMNHDVWIYKLQEAIDANIIKEVAFPIFFDSNLKGNFSNHKNKAHAALLIVSFQTGCCT